MRIKPSAGILAAGLTALIVGVFLAFVRHTDEYGDTTYPVFMLGVSIVLLGLGLLAVGVYRFAHNVDLAAAKYVDGPGAVEKLTQPRDVRKRVDQP